MDYCVCEETGGYPYCETCGQLKCPDTEPGTPTAEPGAPAPTAEPGTPKTDDAPTADITFILHCFRHQNIKLATHLFRTGIFVPQSNDLKRAIQSNMPALVQFLRKDCGAEWPRLAWVYAIDNIVGDDAFDGKDVDADPSAVERWFADSVDMIQTLHRLGCPFRTAPEDTELTHKVGYLPSNHHDYVDPLFELLNNTAGYDWDDCDVYDRHKQNAIERAFRLLATTFRYPVTDLHVKLALHRENYWAVKILHESGRIKVR